MPQRAKEGGAAISSDGIALNCTSYFPVVPMLQSTKDGSAIVRNGAYLFLQQNQLIFVAFEPILEIACNPNFIVLK